MNNHIKKILSEYMLKCVIVTCVLCLCAGAVTAKQRSEYNSKFTPYAVLSVKSAGDELNVNIDNRSYSIDLGKAKEFEKYRKYLYFTPFSCVAFFFDSIYEFFSSFKD